MTFRWLLYLSRPVSLEETQEDKAFDIEAECSLKLTCNAATESDDIGGGEPEYIAENKGSNQLVQVVEDCSCALLTSSYYTCQMHLLTDFYNPKMSLS